MQVSNLASPELNPLECPPLALEEGSELLSMAQDEGEGRLKKINWENQSIVGEGGMCWNIFYLGLATVVESATSE